MKTRLQTTLLGTALALGLVAGGGPLMAREGRGGPVLSLDGIATPPLRVLEDAREPSPLGQVRIQQRVIVRIAPSTRAEEERFAALRARQSTPTPQSPPYREVPHDGCVRVDNIVGVQPTRDNRLLLFMENRNVLAAELDRACAAQAFYSGFYVERASDGRLCVRRDHLQSRAGASCAMEQLTRLVPAGE